MAYPNPARDHLLVDINLADTEHVEVRILDMVGRTVKHIKKFNPEVEGTLEINTNNLRNGVYFLHINGDEGTTEIQKVVIKK